MKVGVVMAGTSGSLENNNVSYIEFHPGASVKNVFETGMSCPHEGTEQFGITIKPGSQELRHGQYDMSISYAGQQPSSDEVGPSVGIDLGTGKAEAGFAGESDTSYFSAVAASVLNKAHFIRVAAIKHLLDGFIVVRVVKAWMQLFKRIPVIVENLFKSVFIYAFHGCSLRTTITEVA